ncbi:hypothetical protein NliqN6_5781 [Naganishia liquefaciens]|uniref:Cysteine-rich PDZ-binding protein n=1 Tax=Naganishia liquefaciens TaxID=104408 RepID=A0A8H3YH20_9TREE|nr:hypothetical protein NliqN6_5781 [Naganishia liquefaciens]
MVCKKCEKKTTKLATTDPFQASSSKTRTIGENKLLSSKKAARASPYANGGKKCLNCPNKVQQVGGTRCQQCAYKKGLCAICGTVILDTSRYKQSVA